MSGSSSDVLDVEVSELFPLLEDVLLDGEGISLDTLGACLSDVILFMDGFLNEGLGFVILSNSGSSASEDELELVSCWILLPTATVHFPESILSRGGTFLTGI